MRIDIITVLPELFDGPLSQSIVKRAIERKLVGIHIHNLRDFGLGKYKQVDDTPYGGGAGMVLMIEPVAACIESLTDQRTYDDIIYVCPDAPTFNQAMANKMSLLENIIILCGHYKGIDERIREKYITREISIGDYVITGGELAAAVIIDASVRLIPGVINDEESALTDSFQDGLLSPPVYTRPAEFDGMKVPEILLSGNFPKIDEWRMDEAYKRTEAIRPDLIDKKDSN